MLEIVLQGILLGFGLILPLGVQNLFVFNQGATQPSYLRALPAVITASVCDTILISTAVLGLSLVVLTFSWLKAVLYGFGFFFLIYMGWVIWRSEPIESTMQRRSEPKKQILFAASVSLMNPHAILDTIGVIGINSLNYSGAEKWVFTVSIILVSWIWFFGLAFAGRQAVKFDSRGKFISLLNKASAIIIWGLAIYMGLSLWR